MNPDDYCAFSTERLLESFAAASKRLEFASQHLETQRRLRADIPLQPNADLAERKQAALQVRALGDALRSRGPLPEVESLLQDDDPNVRAAAAISFASVWPELARAAFKGALADRPTREVLAVLRRARLPSPDKPVLEEISDDKLIVCFEDAATRLSGATLFLDWDDVSDRDDNPGDAEARNQLICEVESVLKEVKTRNLLSRLVPLLESVDFTVRLWAARGCLRVAEAKALGAIDAVISGGQIVEQIEAREVRDFWRTGSCLIDRL